MFRKISSLFKKKPTNDLDGGVFSIQHENHYNIEKVTTNRPIPMQIETVNITEKESACCYGNGGGGGGGWTELKFVGFTNQTSDGENK